MNIPPVGIFTLIVGIICLMSGYRATAIAFCTMTVFGGAAAVLLGSAGIQPGHLFVGFLALATLSYREKMQVALNALAPPNPAFWLVCLLVYGGIAGYFAPRLWAQTMQIIPLGSSEYPDTGGAVPLGPVSSNFTQVVYYTADIVTFVMVVALGSTMSGFRAVTVGVMAFSAANLFFGILDMVGAGTAVQDWLGFIRNAPYAFHDEDVVAGVKRVVGSWPEASTFACISLGAVGFTGTLRICGRYSRVNGFLFLLSSIMVIRSTSSSGLFGLPVCLVILYFTCLMRCGGQSGTRFSAGVVLFAPIIIVLLGMLIIMDQAIFHALYAYFDLLLFSKATSASGVERGMWNLYGWNNFLDSYGLGVGLGTSRTSSFIFALLSNVGIPGTLFFGLFFLTAFMTPRGEARTFDGDVRLAARNGCLCLLVGAVVAVATVDTGLLFFVMAALATAVPSHEDETAIAAIPMRV
ncbi:hypothetical protein [Neorhizobium sp. NCHU2750]|uniref:hypothetical protein n=1 Tax=Neorhizobium sp. NCHU2750 TaxID=1825976 RepID=UPI000E76C561|nr:integral cytoplasmic membrane protein [Neorhizobium sp. NCHU2750]